METGMGENKVYVVVGKIMKESKSTLLWALHNSEGRQICILHVHQPAQKIPIMGTKFQINQLKADQVDAYREFERQDMHQLLDKYKQICQQTGVCAEVHYIEKDSVEKGIVEFILEHNVTSLMMGGAANRHYSRRMVDLRSTKAMYVRLLAAPSCQIQFICRGNIIFTRPGRLHGAGVSISSPSLLPNTNFDSGRQSFLRSRSQ